MFSFFNARDQILQLQPKLLSSIVAINYDIKAYRVATYTK